MVWWSMSLLALMTGTLPQPSPSAKREIVSPPARHPGAFLSDMGYPRAALRLKQEGAATVSVHVSAGGKVESCVLTQTSGSRSLDDATCKLARQSRFIPARNAKNEAVPGDTQYQMNWRLPHRPYGCPEPCLPTAGFTCMPQVSPIQKIGLGLAAGLIGTIVMTLAQRAEMAVTDRPPSKTPAEAVEAITRTDLREPVETRVSNVAHFAYGTALGSALALLDDVAEPSRTLAFLAASESIGMAILQTLDLDGKPSEWDASTAAIDVGHHLVYALTAGLAYAGGRALLQRRARD